MQIRERRREKKHRVAVSRRAEKGEKWNGNDSVYVLLQCSIYSICVFEHLPKSCKVSH